MCYKVKRWKNENRRNESKYISSYSMKYAAALDFREVLQYPICPVPLSIINGDDGTRRRTSKSKLKEVFLIRARSLDK